MNIFEKFDWQTMLAQYPQSNYDIKAYHEILCPRNDWPPFLQKYVQLPILQRLSGIGLLCGTDWTKLYKNRFYYSRLDHSIGVALIVWHFTHNKAQTLAGLLHDISTPVFSHVSDFRKGDALTQTATEEPTAKIIRENKELCELLLEDGLLPKQVEDYHIYPIADNEIPQLSADRLEYMFPSGMALYGCWTLQEIKRCYNDLLILQNEKGFDELGFKNLETAELYCEKFCMIGHILQLNENKLTLHLLGQIMNLAEKQSLVCEQDFMTRSEQEIIAKLDSIEKNSRIWRLYQTFRNMTSIIHCETALDENKYFCVNLKVKQRYINPLVRAQNGKVQRLSELSEKAQKIIKDFKTYSDTNYGCVKLV